MATIDDIRARIAALRAQIQRHDYLYYVLDRPEISDAAYDRLYAELVRLAAAHPELVTPDSPTQRVAGEPPGSLPEARHVAPMLSLEAVTSEDEGSLEELLRARASDLAEILGVGPHAAAQVAGFFARPANRRSLETFLARGLRPRAP